jgi:hypothetical protein
MQEILASSNRNQLLDRHRHLLGSNLNRHHHSRDSVDKLNPNNNNLQICLEEVLKNLLLLFLVNLNNSNH